MKCVLMCGGFAKRMWPLTLNTPKPLLPIAGRPIIEYILDKLDDVEEVDLIYISTNKKFERYFKEEMKNFKTKKPVKLIIEPAVKEEEKLGSVGALGFLIKEEKINDDLLIIAGDNLFDFSLVDFINYYKSKSCPVIALYDMKDKEKVRGRYGVVLLDKNNKIIGFEEKPNEPKSTFVSTACYILPKETLKLVLIYLSKNNPDAFGYFIEWLHKMQDVYGFLFPGRWFDIGSLDSYREADLSYSSS